MVLLSEFKDWDRFQKEAVFVAFERFHADMLRINHPLAKAVNYTAGYQSMQAGEVQAVIVDNQYLLVYAIGTQWYKTGKFLFEEMILRLGTRPGSVIKVVRAMDQIAREQECIGIVAGNATGRLGIHNLYRRAGYIPLATQLYKEVIDGRSS